MKKINLLSFLIVFLAIYSNAQTPNRCSYVTPRQADNWFFRQNSGIKFEGEYDQVTVTTNNLPAGNNNIPYSNGTATYSDENGNLLIYSDGMNVWNSNHDKINNGIQLSGDWGSTQPALIVQNPVATQMLYVFTTDINSQSTSTGLCYNRVDMTANGGAGSVMDSNKVLLPDAISAVCGTRNSSGTGYWIVSRKEGTNEFSSFLVDASGVNTSAVNSSGGAVIHYDENNQAISMLKISPAGDKLALAAFKQGIVELYDFDNSSGKVSYVTTITVPVPNSFYGPYQIEFSPNGSKLYVTVVSYTLNPNVVYPSTLYQYDLANGMAETLLNDVPAAQDPWALQLGRDGKIYVTRKNVSVLGVIENPNRSGVACNYNENGQSLGAGKGMLGLPNFISSFLNVPPLDYDTKCDGDLTQFKMLNTSNIDFVDWNFGDATSADNVLIAGPTNPIHSFTGPGNYTVTYTEHYNGGSWSDSLHIVINALPDSIFADDTIPIIEGSSIHMYALPGMYSYYWSPDGGTNIDYTITKPGTYMVLMENMQCCVNRDTVTVIPLNLKIPSAFSPDNDGLNDYFRALADANDIIDFSLSVFNKWGQMVWETNDVQGKWDGKIGSNPAPTGIYTWYITLNLPGNTMNKGKYKVNGTLILFR
ncbi:MAG TPA: gliding motility-associated C-terminal domain-containing protein [Lentimicrobium sp.]|nr:gliding motility-associated C-terminal domain-containing protein [Lentimicrobium sp.]